MNKMAKLTIRLKIILLLVAASASVSLAQKKFSHTNSTFTDPRDGETYETITFIKEYGDIKVERTWYAENVRYEVAGSYCYNDEVAYCKKYGRLYNYEEANQACPDGWHVPTITEWGHLFEFFGGRHKAGQYLISGGESDMHMLYGGFGEPGVEDHIFKDIARSGNWWDNELKGENSAGIITIITGSGEIYHEVIGDKHKLSCRCVKFHD